MIKPATLLSRAKRMRTDPTKAESVVWNIVRANQLGCKFKRQFPIGEYILDFYCHTLKLCIEIDGEQHGFEKQEQYDQKREKYLINLGIKTVRIWNTGVLENTEDIYHNLENIVTIRMKELHLSDSGLLSVV